MKKHVLMMTGLALLSFGATGATSGKNIKEKKNIDNKINKSIKSTALGSTAIHDGLRVGLVTANKSMDLKFSNKTNSITSKEENPATGFSIGYQKILVNSWAWSSIFSMTNTGRKNVSINNTMVEGNGTFGINENLYSYVGLNISKNSTTNKAAQKTFDDLGNGVGLQAAIGYQVTRNISAELKYQSTLHLAKYEATYTDGSKDEIDVELKTSALYLGINGTF
jgi:hypothetical protein